MGKEEERLYWRGGVSFHSLGDETFSCLPVSSRLYSSHGQPVGIGILSLGGGQLKVREDALVLSSPSCDALPDLF